MRFVLKSLPKTLYAVAAVIVFNVDAVAKPIFSLFAKMTLPVFASNAIWKVPPNLGIFGYRIFSPKNMYRLFKK